MANRTKAKCHHVIDIRLLLVAVFEGFAYISTSPQHDAAAAAARDDVASRCDKWRKTYVRHHATHQAAAACWLASLEVVAQQLIRGSVAAITLLSDHGINETLLLLVAVKENLSAAN